MNHFFKFPISFGKLNRFIPVHYFPSQLKWSNTDSESFLYDRLEVTPQHFSDSSYYFHKTKRPSLLIASFDSNTAKRTKTLSFRKIGRPNILPHLSLFQKKTYFFKKYFFIDDVTFGHKPMTTSQSVCFIIKQVASNKSSLLLKIQK